MALQNLQKAVDMDAALKGMQGMVTGLQETVGKLEGKMDGLKGVVMVLEEEVNKLKDIEAIRTLQFKFADNMYDAGAWRDNNELFANREDCVLDIGGKEYEGWDAIREGLEKLCGNLRTRGLRLFVEGIVEVEEGGLKAQVEGTHGQGGDFVKEGSEWKIWKIRVNSDEGLTLSSPRVSR
ncbi:hypothetical protein PRZ48_013778 [Zasmidium cellare]|uniref:Uncharacterized protein n=1 Tax=Zasmidium cellare TaxID=395010 RepID=A0ABR0E1Z9_ZASCE|nr:hypothetical protein PRZ48_013778 [Zasmidium cellare]